jgi:hypothetical protein
MISLLGLLDIGWICFCFKTAPMPLHDTCQNNKKAYYANRIKQITVAASVSLHQALQFLPITVFPRQVAALLVHDLPPMLSLPHVLVPLTLPPHQTLLPQPHVSSALAVEQLVPNQWPNPQRIWPHLDRM